MHLNIDNILCLRRMSYTQISLIALPHALMNLIFVRYSNLQSNKFSVLSGTPMSESLHGTASSTGTGRSPPPSPSPASGNNNYNSMIQMDDSIGSIMMGTSHSRYVYCTRPFHNYMPIVYWQLHCSMNVTYSHHFQA